MGSIRFRATLLARGPAAAIVLDEQQVSTVGEGAKRFPVRATVNGYSSRTTVARMRGEFLVGLSREVREGASVAAGDSVARKEYARWIAEAKRDETRERRIVQALERLCDGKPPR